jgi:hypothetical protein
MQPKNAVSVYARAGQEILHYAQIMHRSDVRNSLHIRRPSAAHYCCVCASPPFLMSAGESISQVPPLFPRASMEGDIMKRKMPRSLEEENREVQEW